MRVGLQTWGSQGDIRPLAALAWGLQRAGHEVTLVVTSVDPGDYEALAARLSIDLRCVASPVIADPAALEAIGLDLIREGNALRQARTVLTRTFEPAVAEMYEAAAALCRDSDLVIGHFFHYPLRIAAEKLGCPHASVMLVHSAVASRHYPPAGLPDLGAWANPLLWRLLRALFNRTIKPFPDRLRARVGLPPAGDLLDDVWASRALNLIAVSAAFCARQDDWAPQHQVCGFLDPSAAGGGQERLDPALERFLGEGAPPVYVSFGSTPLGRAGVRRQLLDLLAEAAARASCRMIVQAPSWVDCGVEPSAAVHYVSAAPHALVFPRCAAVIHHGGAGTVHSATRAGRPSVVVPHHHEQWFWGRELKRLGLAPAPLWRRDLTAASLAARLSEALRSTDMEARAQAAAERLRQEDGIATAVELIAARFPS